MAKLLNYRGSEITPYDSGKKTVSECCGTAYTTSAESALAGVHDIGINLFLSKDKPKELTRLSSMYGSDRQERKQNSIQLADGTFLNLVTIHVK